MPESIARCYGKEDSQISPYCPQLCYYHWYITFQATEFRISINFLSFLFFEIQICFWGLCLNCVTLLSFYFIFFTIIYMIIIVTQFSYLWYFFLFIYFLFKPLLVQNNLTVKFPIQLFFCKQFEHIYSEYVEQHGTKFFEQWGNFINK